MEQDYTHKNYFTTFDPYLEHGEALQPNATVLDYLFATREDHALRLSRLHINGARKPFGTVPVPGDDLEYSIAANPTVSRSWLDAVQTTFARAKILQETHSKPNTAEVELEQHRQTGRPGLKLFGRDEAANDRSYIPPNEPQRPRRRPAYGKAALVAA